MNIWKREKGKLEKNWKKRKREIGEIGEIGK